MDSGFALYDADDARLLRLVGVGNAEAFGVLSERHAWAARKLARQLVLPEDVEEVVADAFGRVRAVVGRGGGPSNALRPYVLTALRRVCDERQRGQLSRLSPDDQQADPGAPLVDPAVAGAEQTLAARAYLSLPERWCAVLWHTEIEQEHPLVVTPLLGLARNGIAALNREAIDGLRQAFVQLYVMALAQPKCESVAERLDAYVRDALPASDATQIWEHLRGCVDCRKAYDELADIGGTLRGTVAPLILGSAADAYLVGSKAPAVSDLADNTGTLTLSPANGEDSAQGASATPKPRGSRHARRRVPRSVAIAAAVTLAALLSGIIAFALDDRPYASTGTGNAMASPPASSVGGPAQVAPSSPPPSPIPISAAAPPAANPTSGAQTLTTLSASIDISPVQFGSTRPGSGSNTDEVGFEVANTGSVATGPLVVAISLPPGSALSDTSPGGMSPGFTGGVPEGTGSPSAGVGDFGWSCESTEGGITCMHAPVPAGQHVNGRLAVTISDFMSCGQPVRLTASSGPVRAQAAQELRC